MGGLPHLSDPAAGGAGAAGVGAVLLLPEDQRRDRLVDLDRGVAHARREGGGVQSVLAGPGAGAAGVKGVHGERPAVAVVAVGAAVAAPQHRVPEAARALGRDPALGRAPWRERVWQYV